LVIQPIKAASIGKSQIIEEVPSDESARIKKLGDKNVVKEIVMFEDQKIKTALYTKSKEFAS
jgi:hypothetical protein